MAEGKKALEELKRYLKDSEAKHLAFVVQPDFTATFERKVPEDFGVMGIVLRKVGDKIERVEWVKVGEEHVTKRVNPSEHLRDFYVHWSITKTHKAATLNELLEGT